MIRIHDTFRIPGKITTVTVLMIIFGISYLVTGIFAANQPFLLAGSIIPAEFFHSEGMSEPIYTNPEIANIRAPLLLTVFWSMFLHGGFFHVFFNILFLYLLGPNVLLRMGWRNFLLFFFACHVVGALAHVLAFAGSTAPMVGPTGAIGGLMGAYTALFSDHQFRFAFGKNYAPNYREIMIPFKAILAMWALNQFFEQILSMVGGSYSTGLFANVGGFLCGLFLAQRLIGGHRGGGKRKPPFQVFDGGRDSQFWGRD